MPSEHDKALRWQRDTSTPARVYAAEGFEIIWDPAGPVEGEPGGWYLRKGSTRLGVFRTLAGAKARAEWAR